MAVYYVNLLLILVAAVPLCIIKPARWKKILYIVLTFSYMWFLATFRQDIGFDYRAYIAIFENVKAAGSFSELLAQPQEIGFVLLTKLMAMFVPNAVVMYGVYEVLILVPVAWFIYRYCKDVWLSVWLFVTLTFYYISMNFIRQALAGSVVLLGYKFLREKKPIPFFLIVILAALFHKTALIMIPVYFFAHIRLDKKWGAIYAAAALLFYLFSEQIVDVYTRFFFSGYRDTIWLEEGFPLMYVLFPAAYFATCLVLRSRWEKREPDADLLLNLMLFSVIIWLFITRHFILERFSLYVYYFVILALPSALSSLKCSDEEIREHAEMKARLDSGKKGKPSKEALAAYNALGQKISDHKKYYVCAVAALILVSAIYHDFGANVNGFHGVFPYQSVLEWLT